MRIKRVILSMIGVLFIATAAAAVGVTKSAKAELINAQGVTIGTAVLTEVPGGVRISLKVSQLSPGTHAFHIHAVGKADPPDFKSAGPHFNPEGKQHGKKNPLGAHAGDLSNIDVKVDGTAQVEMIVSGVTLAPGKDSLLQPGGTSLVIHAAADDEKTDPAGNAGARIAAGVITASS